MFFVLLFFSEPFVTKQTMLKPQSFKISVVVSTSLLSFYIVQRLFDVEKDDILGSSVRSREILVDAQVWQYRLWSFHGRDTKLERFFAINQL